MCFIPPEPPWWGHVSAGFWSWCNPCFSFDFCHSNLDLHPWVPGCQLALGYLLGRNHSLFYSMLPGFFLPQGGFPKEKGISHRMSDYLCCVLPPSFFIALLGRSDRVPLNSCKGYEPGKFLVSYFIGCDHGIDKFYFVVHFFTIYSFLQKVFLPVIHFLKL